MLANRLVAVCRLVGARNFHTSFVRKDVDPIQQLFVNKVKDYFQQKGKSSEALVGASAITQKALQEHLARVDAQFQASGKNMTDFPSFQFVDEPVEPCGGGGARQETEVEEVAFELKRHGWPEDKNLHVFT